MEKKFICFPYSKSTWVLSINQLSDPQTSAIFSGEIISDIDTSHCNELNAAGDHTSYLQQTIINCQKVFKRLKHIFIFYTNVYFDANSLVSSCSLTVMHLPYFLLRSTLTKLSQFTEWDISDMKAILLIGDTRRRIHKFPLLYHFYSKNNLNVLNYSLIDAAELSSRWHTDYFGNVEIDYLNNLNKLVDDKLDKESFKQVYKKLTKKFDEVYPSTSMNGIDSGTYDFPKEWNTACCNLVVESTFFNFTIKEDQSSNYHIQKYQPEQFFFSEKIWKPLLSGKPFITISNLDKIYIQLEKLGFRTFLKYTDSPNYIRERIVDNNELINPESFKKYLNLCYSRTTSFLKNVVYNKPSIKEDVMHNKDKWLELTKCAWKEVYANCPPIRYVTKREFCEFFNHSPNTSLFDKWYTKE